MPLGSFRLNSLAKYEAPSGGTPITAFDGTQFNAGEYLRTTSITTNAMSSTSKTATVSFWIKLNNPTIQDFGHIWSMSTNASSDNNVGLQIFFRSTNQIVFYGYKGVANGWVMQLSTPTNLLTVGEWTHISFSYDRSVAGKFSCYKNGQAVTLTNTRFNNDVDGWNLATRVAIHATAFDAGFNSTDISLSQFWLDDTYIDLSSNNSKFYNDGPVDLGANGTGSGLSQPMIYHTGGSSAFATNNGRTSGTYLTYTLTATGTLQTDPYTNINRYGYAFSDTSGAVISTTNPKIGTGSLRLPAGTDTLKTTIPHTAIPVGSDWTVEGWVNLDNASFSGYQYGFYFPNGGINFRGFGGGSVVIEFYITDRNGANAVNWNGNLNGASGTAASGVWYHWAVVFYNGYFNIYGNGVNTSNRGPYSDQYTLFSTSTTANTTGIGTGSFIGNFDEVRVSNVARYTQNFTPSTTAFVNDSATILLWHNDGTNNSKNFVDDQTAFNTVSTVSHHATQTSLGSTITIPSTIQAGDVAILFDSSTTVTDTVPANWTPITKASVTGIRQNVSYKILSSGDANTTITGMAGTTRKVLLVYRPNVAATAINATVSGSQATTSIPTNQTLVGESGPVVTFAVYSSSGSITTRGWSVGSPTEYSSVSTSSIYVKALITNSGTPSNTVISMTDGGTNALQSFCVEFL